MSISLDTPPAPPRDIVVRAGVGRSYYDATATNRESDFGAWVSTVSEDFYFNSSTRAVAISRLRREVRNNPYLAGLVAKFPEAIGQPTLRARTPDRGYNHLKDSFWYTLARRMTLAGDSLRTTVDLLKGEMLVAGELFFIKLATGLLQLVPSEFCGTNMAAIAELPEGYQEINGIVRDLSGNPAFYRFGQMSPTGLLNFSGPNLIPAKNVIHVFKKDRVHMGRGLPWLLPALRPAHDLYEITRAKTKQIKDVTSIFGTIEKQGSADFLRGLEAPSIDSTTGEIAAESGTSAADPVKTSATRVELRPGTFIALEPGEKLNKLTSDYQASDYKELVMLMLHAISTPIGLPVELWFSGLGDVNYSGFKGLGVQWDARRKDLHAFLEESFLQPYHDWRLSLAPALRELPPLPANCRADEVDWRWRRTAVLDEEKIRKANQVALSTGELSLADIWEERGEYAEDVFAARRQLWIKLQVAAGLLEDTGDHADVEVPLCFLLTGALPEPPAPARFAAPPADPAAPTDPKPAAPTAKPLKK
jgi:hypothetical protein